MYTIIHLQIDNIVYPTFQITGKIFLQLLPSCFKKYTVYISVDYSIHGLGTVTLTSHCLIP